MVQMVITSLSKLVYFGTIHLNMEWKEVMVQLRTTRRTISDPQCNSLLSFHCWSRKVIAALWSQPGAVPLTLVTMWPKTFAWATKPTLSLEQAGKLWATKNPAQQVEPLFHHLSAPMWLQAPVTVLSDYSIHGTSYINSIFFSLF